MHPSAMNNCLRFHEVYGKDFSGDVTVLDIGSQNVNGCLKDVFPTEWKYIGVDYTPGSNVDIVLEDEYKFPVETQSVDIVITSSCFEHAELFWLTFLEGMRVLKPHGLFFLNAPTAGYYHAGADCGGSDCWRFWPDSGRALSKWANRNGMNNTLLESFVSDKIGCQNVDYIAVFLKDIEHIEKYPDRIMLKYDTYYNGRIQHPTLNNLKDPVLNLREDVVF